MKKITFLEQKKWYLLFLFASFSYFSNAQCVNSTPFGFITVLNTGQPETISTCTYST